MTQRTTLLLLFLVLAALLGACDTAESPFSGGANIRNMPGIPPNVDTYSGFGVPVPSNAVIVSIVYAPESHDYMPHIIEQFNQSYANGLNPITGERLAEGERPVYVIGKQGSSGTVMQAIVNAITGAGHVNDERPVIFQPSVSHWLLLANYLARRTIFDLNDAQPTALAPVVMAIWESRLQAIRQTVGYDDIGWEELLMVLNSPNGWGDFGISGRRTVYYGHTDPYISSTALSTLIAEYYASAAANGFTARRLTLDIVRNPEVQEGVRQIENLIRHYSSRTTEFRHYIAQGPDYLDFVALEENDLIAINRGLTEFMPPERLVALYPKEGTFWHEHPFGIVNAPWTSDEQRAAARIFTEYVLLPDNQSYIMTFGFRPANPEVPLGFPFEEQYGVTLAGPTTVLDVPAADVVAAIQESWSFVKKQADIMLLIDVSGSMAQEGRLDQAKAAALAFLDNTEATNRVGLTIFNNNVEVRIPLDTLESNDLLLRSHITSLRASGGTALYDAVVATLDAMNQLKEENRIRAIVLLSDGEDTESRTYRLDDVVQAIQFSYNDLNPVIVIPVAYGSTADIRTLDRIASASNTTRQSGDPSNIQRILELISSFF